MMDVMDGMCSVYLGKRLQGKIPFGKIECKLKVTLKTNKL
jgi:hypothetical protein